MTLCNVSKMSSESDRDEKHAKAEANVLGDSADASGSSDDTNDSSESDSSLNDGDERGNSETLVGHSEPVNEMLQEEVLAVYPHDGSDNLTGTIETQHVEESNGISSLNTAAEEHGKSSQPASSNKTDDDTDESDDDTDDTASSASSGVNGAHDNSNLHESATPAVSKKEIDTGEAVRQLNAMFGSDSESDDGAVERRRLRNQQEQELADAALPEAEHVQNTSVGAGSGGATVGELFGSDVEGDDDSDNSEIGKKKLRSVAQTANASLGGKEVSPAPSTTASVDGDGLAGLRRVQFKTDDDEYGSGAFELQLPPQQLVEVNIPFLDPELSQDDLVLLRNPKFFQIDSRPFTEEFYTDGFDDNVADEENKVLDPLHVGLLKKYVENTVRWRENLSVDDEGTIMHLDESSNARIVEWSDGSYSLFVGDKYVGEISERPIDEHVHLFVEMSGQLHGTAVLKKKFLGKSDEVVSRGSGRGGDAVVLTSSSALVAQKLARETKRVEYVGTTGMNPELLRAEMWKKEEEKQKATTKRESAQRRVRERAHMRGISAKYLEVGAAGVAEGGGGGDDEDENTISLTKIKREANVRSRQLGRGAYDDESEGEFDDFIAKGNDVDEDDDEDDFGVAKRRKKERKGGDLSSSSVAVNDRSAAIKKNPLAGLDDE